MTTEITTERLDLDNDTKLQVATVKLDEDTARKFTATMKSLPGELERIEILILIDLILSTYGLTGEDRLHVLEMLAIHGVGSEMAKRKEN